MKASQFTTAILTTVTYVSNTEAKSHPDYGNTDYQVLKPGQKVNIYIQNFEDGRVYYTAYIVVNGIFYCNTKMKDTTGKIIPNCGGLRASYDLSKMNAPKC